MIYLDYNATTPVAAPVQAEVLKYLAGEFGNPSSVHAKGRSAKLAVDQAREAVGALLGADPDEILFTGSATEANNLALFGAAAAMPASRRHLIVSAVEHPAVMAPAAALAQRGWEVSVAPVDRQGRVDLSRLRALLGPHTGLVSVMHVNNELGTIQPVEALAPLVHRAGALLHVDAAQSVGKLPIDVAALGADLLTIAGHKMYAPKGIGALYVRRGVDLRQLLHGAGQEQGKRPGTENVPYIAGLGAAAQYVSARMQQKRMSMAALRDRLEQRLTAGIPGLTVNGDRHGRAPNTLHLSLPQGDAHELVHALADRVAISPGAACHSGNHGAASGVMHAIGATAQQARGAVRISLGYDTTAEEIEQAANEILEEYRLLRSR